MKELIEESGLKLKEFAELYNIPYNTIRQWYNEERKCPKYIKSLILQIRELKSKGEQLNFFNDYLPHKKYYMCECDWLNNGHKGLRAVFDKEESRNNYAKACEEAYPGSKIYHTTLIEIYD